MKKILSTLLLLFGLIDLSFAAFDETWIYLFKGEESSFPPHAPFTDIACFSAAVNSNGGLTGGHLVPPSLPGARADARYHLVITVPWNTTLSHIYLNKELPLRNKIIAEIVKRSRPFDGVQIDIEAVDKADSTAYLNFIAAVKHALPKDKIFSVAVMARWDSYIQSNPDDAFNYPLISRFADRVIVMAYDEHYTSGLPGSIASLEWCDKIYSYAVRTIDPGKLIMGLPLYGRSWQSPSYAKAHKNSDIQKELNNRSIRPETSPTVGGSYSYSATVTVNVHFETIESIQAKLTLYATKPTRGVAFWRIGQEPAGLWQQLP